MGFIVLGVFIVICVMLGYLQSIGEECNALYLSEGIQVVSFQKRFIRICYCAITNGFCFIMITYNAKILDQIYQDISQDYFYQILILGFITTTIVFAGIHFLTNTSSSVSCKTNTFKYEKRVALIQTMHMVFLFIYSFIAYYFLVLLCVNILL